MTRSGSREICRCAGKKRGEGADMEEEGETGWEGGEDGVKTERNGREWKEGEEERGKVRMEGGGGGGGPERYGDEGMGHLHGDEKVFMKYCIVPWTDRRRPEVPPRATFVCAMAG